MPNSENTVKPPSSKRPSLFGAFAPLSPLSKTVGGGAATPEQQKQDEMYAQYLEFSRQQKEREEAAVAAVAAAKAAKVAAVEAKAKRAANIEARRLAVGLPPKHPLTTSPVPTYKTPSGPVSKGIAYRRKSRKSKKSKKSRKSRKE